MDPQTPTLCDLCTSILSRSISSQERRDSSLPIKIADISGTVARPDLDFIRRSSLAGCRLCSEMIRIHWTRICNAYDGTTTESDATEALEAVSLKFPRISIDMVADDGDGKRRPYWILVYKHSIVEDELNGSLNVDEKEEEEEKELDPVVDDAADEEEDISHGSQSRFGHLGDSVLDMESALFTMMEVMESYDPQLFPKPTLERPSDTTASDSSWAQCMLWLDHCTSSHTSCHQPLFPERALPKRLINVGDEHNAPYLCLSSELPSSTEYITLSHCWGHSKVITLTSETKAKFENEIPISELSQTFKDAITITCRLSLTYGIKHLWIDSLCILQDSKEEWLSEAPRMAEVYGNCWCNLAATSGGGISTRPAGIFSHRNPDDIKAVQVSLSTSSLTDKEYTIVDASRWTGFIKRAPLNRRAWVFQERLLSPRILHFGVDEIYWECATGRASETFPTGELTVDVRDAGRDEALMRVKRVMENDISPLEEWLVTVEAFTECDLTYPSDKLFAIAGLAKLFRERLGGCGEYLAGIWRMEIERQLMWIVGPTDHPTRSKKYRAPSWCWSSIDGPVLSTWAPGESQILVQTLEANIVLKGTDSFGDVSSGFLRLKGRVLKGRSTSDAHYFPGLRIYLDEKMNEIAFHPDEEIDPNSKDHLEVFCVPVSVEHMGDDTDDKEEINDDEAADEIEGNERTEDGDGEDEEDEEDEDEEERSYGDDGEEDVRLILKGLVLQLSNVARGQYRRIGAFETHVPKEVEIILHKQAPVLEDSEYEEIDGCDQYIISII